MEQLQFTITVANGQTLFAEVRPEDERKLAELLGDRSTIQLAPSDDDLEGHAMSDDIVVDVEGHAMVASTATPCRCGRTPSSAGSRRRNCDARRRWRNRRTSTGGADNDAGCQIRLRSSRSTVPAAALRAQQNEMTRERSLNAVRSMSTIQRCLRRPCAQSAGEFSVPAAAAAAQEDEMTQQQGQQAVPLDAENPAVPRHCTPSATASPDQRRAEK